MSALKCVVVLCLFCGWVMGCSEPAKEILGNTADGEFELVLRADPNWVRPNGTLLVALQVRRLDPRAQLDVNDHIRLVANNGTLTPTSVTPDFSPALGDTVASQVYQTWVEFRAPSISFSGPTGEQQSEIYAIFRDLRATFKVRVVPFLGE